MFKIVKKSNQKTVSDSKQIYQNLLAETTKDLDKIVKQDRSDLEKTRNLFKAMQRSY